MRPGGAAARRLGVAALVVLGLGACRDSGLPDRNLPLDEARFREFRYPAYQPLAQSAPVAAAGRVWIGAASVETVPQRLLTPVATVEGVVLYGLRNQVNPGRLYAPVGEDRWQPYLRLY
jgi:hypothetical protein